VRRHFLYGAVRLVDVHHGEQHPGVLRSALVLLALLLAPGFAFGAQLTLTER
jgi:hypothetical protein